MAPKVAIVFYSMYGHIKALAEAEKAGLKKAGIEADIYQVAETLPQEVLTKVTFPLYSLALHSMLMYNSQMHAPPKSDYPVIDAKTLESYDAFLFGIPTRYGNFPAQWKAFWDTTGGQWAAGGFWGKYAGVFVSTGTQGGGQESTVIAAMSTLVHHGIVFVPLGYKHTFGQLANLTEIRGGSPWGAGTFSAADGSRMPSALELEVATIQGEQFGLAVSKINFA
ncbi:Minor allergen Alt a 7 [Mollisiaceae sp. DMI_Dod_QoI]|nr:Minor allergen Alt a 7 [Helotiales sp. DMI_Dod_QoI]